MPNYAPAAGWDLMEPLGDIYNRIRYKLGH